MCMNQVKRKFLKTAKPKIYLTLIKLTITVRKEAAVVDLISCARVHAKPICHHVIQ